MLSESKRNGIGTWPATPGGYALFVAAVVGAVFFRGVPSALALLVAPALLTGMVLAVVGR